MKNIFKSVLVVFIFLFSSIVHAGEQCKMPEGKSSAELEMMKSLAGRWSTVTDMFGKKQRLYVDYKVTAGGSAVLETIFPGTPYEMISVYYDEKGKMAMTHYCMMRNRPYMKVAKSTANSISFRVAKIDGPKDKSQPSMGESTLVLKDKNHMVQTCGSKDKPITLEYTRVK